MIALRGNDEKIDRYRDRVSLFDHQLARERRVTGGRRLDLVRARIDSHFLRRIRDDRAVHAKLGVRRGCRHLETQQRNARTEIRKRLAGRLLDLVVRLGAREKIRCGVIGECGGELMQVALAKRDVEADSRRHLDRRSAPELVERRVPTLRRFVGFSLFEELSCVFDFGLRGIRERGPVKAHRDRERRGRDRATRNHPPPPPPNPPKPPSRPPQGLAH